MNERLKQIIFKKLYNDLSNVEIISYNDSIWFINRENKYWYFEYTSAGLLWWRFDFFKNFFNIFCLEPNESELVMSEWVEEVLNHKVTTFKPYPLLRKTMVNEVLNYKVVTSNFSDVNVSNMVEKVLNYKVRKANSFNNLLTLDVENILNHKVITTSFKNVFPNKVEEILNQ